MSKACRAMPGRRAPSRGSPAKPSVSAAATAPTSRTATHGRCHSPVVCGSWSAWSTAVRSAIAVGLLLADLAEFAAITHVGADLADRDQVEHGQRDRPDD